MYLRGSLREVGWSSASAEMGEWAASKIHGPGTTILSAPPSPPLPLLPESTELTVTRLLAEEWSLAEAPWGQGESAN